MVDKPFRPIQVSIDEADGSFERMLRKFVRRTRDSGVMEELRTRRSYRKPSQKRRSAKLAPR